MVNVQPMLPVSRSRPLHPVPDQELISTSCSDAPQALSNNTRQQFPQALVSSLRSRDGAGLDDKLQHDCGTVTRKHWIVFKRKGFRSEEIIYSIWSWGFFALHALVAIFV
jgi:hypothetical protein